jgi:hypothetical protein
VVVVVVVVREAAAPEVVAQVREAAQVQELVGARELQVPPVRAGAQAPRPAALAVVDPHRAQQRAWAAGGRRAARFIGGIDDTRSRS